MASVSFRREGFTKTTELMWKNNPQFAPGYVSVATINDLNNDNERYAQIISQSKIVTDMATDARILLTTELYRYSLAYYENVKRAALVDRITEAEPLYKKLAQFFKKFAHKKKDEPSQEQVIRDAKALLRGTKEGEVILRNQAPQTSGGKHTVIDNTHPTD